MFFQDLRQWLRGTPDKIVTLYLIAVGLLALIVSLFGPPELKLVMLVWMVAP